jgi:hypothetical protein
VGRRSDPETGAIYHLKYKPPPAEVMHRLVQRSDDTEEKVGAWGGRGVVASVSVFVLGGGGQQGGGEVGL